MIVVNIYLIARWIIYRSIQFVFYRFNDSSRIIANSKKRQKRKIHIAEKNEEKKAFLVVKKKKKKIEETLILLKQILQTGLITFLLPYCWVHYTGLSISHLFLVERGIAGAYVYMHTTLRCKNHWIEIKKIMFHSMHLNVKFVINQTHFRYILGGVSNWMTRTRTVKWILICNFRNEKL